jgi:hypothetical protein
MVAECNGQGGHIGRMSYLLVCLCVITLGVSRVS